MSNDQAKDKILGSYLNRVGRMVLACILVAVAIWPMGVQPQTTQAAPVYAPQTPTPPPATPTPVPRPMEPLATPAVSPAATVMPLDEEGPSEPSEPALGPTPLGPEQARQAALSRMRTQVDQGRAPMWDGATLGDYISLYDLSGEITAYLFPVSKGGAPAGYLTVAALDLPNPVLEFSTEGSTPLCGALDLAEQKGYRLTASQRPLYLGLLTYGYELVGPPTGRRLVLDLFTGGTFSVTEEEARVPLRQRVRPDATQPQAQTIQPMVYNLISGVPDWNQFWGSYSCYSGCVPTSATNVIGYWDSHGYDNLINGSDWQRAVNEMRIRMGTRCEADKTGSTSVGRVSPGIICYAQAHGYTFASELWCDGYGAWCAASPTYDRYCAEIDAGRPIVVTVVDHYQYDPDPTKAGDAHTVTGVGYETNGSYMIIHDNWPETGENVYLQYGSGYSSIFMNPVVPGGGGGCPRKGQGDANCDGAITGIDYQCG